MEYFNKYLTNSGVNVLSGANAAVGADYDLAHFFGLSPEIHQAAAEIRKAGKNYVVTPLYWNEEYPIHFKLKNLDPDIPEPELHEQKLTMSYYRKMMMINKVRQQKFILDNSMLVFATGKCEKMQLCRDFDLPEKKVAIIPLGVDLAMGSGGPELFVDKYGIRNFVLCVGEIAQKKNQHLLIEATREKDMHVVFIGKMGGDSDDYSNYCRAIAHEKTHFLGELEPKLLKSAYHAAAVVVQPGLCELPGLPCLCAALAGRPVAATERGTTWDYLGPHASYCDPEDSDSVAASLDTAISNGGSPELKTSLLNRFSWSKSALLTVSIYNKINKLEG